MFLERPVDHATFVCTVTMALMDSRCERRSPRRSVIAFEALVNGVPSHIVDVSNEGVRLELPRERALARPHFVLRVPMVGVGVTVQRKRMRIPTGDEQIDVMWCGGAPVRNTSLADLMRFEVFRQAPRDSISRRALHCRASCLSTRASSPRPGTRKNRGSLPGRAFERQ
jgi:hypothetical protein